MRVGLQRLKDVLRRGLRVRLLARNSGRVGLVARLDRRLARRLGISRDAGTTVVLVQAGAERIVRVRLSAAARAALRRARPRRVPISVEARPVD